MSSSQIIMTLLQIVVMTSIYYYSYTLISDQNSQQEIVFIRHGARSPNKYTPLDEKLWGDQKQGYLTQHGFQQLINVGQQYNNTYLVVDGQCDIEKINLISSVKPRVIHSTIGFIIGLCQKNYQQILHHIFRNYFAQYSIDNNALEQILQSDFLDALKLDFDTFKMKPDHLFHGHDQSQCQVLNKIKGNFLSSTPYIIKNNEFLQNTVFNEVFEQMQISTPLLERSLVDIFMMKTFYGGYKCNKEQGLQQPILSKEAEQYLDEVSIYKFYDLDNSQLIQHQAALTQIFEWIIQQLQQKEHKFSFFIGHDSNQIALLAGLVEEKLLPSFASKLRIIIQGEYVSFYYEQQKLTLKSCKTRNRCTKKEFINYLKNLMAIDIQKLCDS